MEARDAGGFTPDGRPRRLLTDDEIREALARDPVYQEKIRRAEAEMHEVMRQPHETIPTEDLPSFMRDRL